MTEKNFNALQEQWGTTRDTPEWREQLNEEERTLVAKWDASLATARAILAAEKDCEGPADGMPPPDTKPRTVLDDLLHEVYLRYLYFDEYADYGATDEQTKEKYHFAMEQLDWVVSLIRKAQAAPA